MTTVPSHLRCSAAPEWVDGSSRVQIGPSRVVVEVTGEGEALTAEQYARARKGQA